MKSADVAGAVEIFFFSNFSAWQGYRVAQMHRMPVILACHFPQKNPTISGSFADRDAHFKASYASSPPCIHVDAHTRTHVRVVQQAQ